jgi:hypothetical protein
MWMSLLSLAHGAYAVSRSMEVLLEGEKVVCRMMRMGTMGAVRAIMPEFFRLLRGLRGVLGSESGVID